MADLPEPGAGQGHHREPGPGASESAGPSAGSSCGAKADADLSERPGYRDALDRKSTRLNSSHLGISYAVFCLKKKTIRHSRQPAAFKPRLRASVLAAQYG